MAKKLATRGAQYPLSAEFTFSVGDTMTNTSSVSAAFGALASAGTVFDVIKLPPGAVVTGGDVTVETVSNDSGTATIAIGDSTTAARYLGATTIKTAARTALVPTGYRGIGEDLRITLANANGDATTGTVSVRVTYMIGGRMNEVQAT